MSNTKTAPGPKPPPTVDLDQLLGEDTRPEKVIYLCLRGHLQARWDELKAEYDAGPGDEDKAMMVDRARKRRVAEQMAEVEAEMRAGTIAFRLRALPHRRTATTPPGQAVWQELAAKYPPRKDTNGKVNAADLQLGFNGDTIWDEFVRVSIVEPELTDEQWDQLNGRLTDAQFQQLSIAAVNLNRSEIDVPFSRAASITRISDAESRRQNDSASPSSASRAGNRNRSRSTSTTNKAV